MTFGAAQGDRESGVIGLGTPACADRTEADTPRHNSAASTAPPPFAASGGSQQLRIFRRAIREGASLTEACAATGGVIGEAEGKIYLAADAKSPPPPEAYELIPTAPAGDTTMGRPKKQQEDDFDNGDGDGITGEYQRPDAAKAFKIYDEHIAPKKAQISTLTGDCSEPWQTIKKVAHFPRAVMNFLIALENIDDDAKRDHHLLALNEGLKHRKLFVPDDLVTRADGNAGEEVVPTGKRQRPFLAAVNTTDLHDAIGFTEADEAELAQQTGRPSVERANAEAEAAAEDAAVPKPGTGAAAIAAMKKQAEEAGKKG